MIHCKKAPSVPPSGGVHWNYFVPRC
jgi:hypothetical protein